MSSAADLSQILHRIDGRGYKAYHEIRGRFDFSFFSLYIDRVQSDPFAAPSLLRLRIPMRTAGIPEMLLSNRVRRTALADFLARAARRAIDTGGSRRSGSGKSGLISIDAGDQEVLERTAVRITEDWIEARIELGLPASGRRVLGRAAEELLLEQLPAVVNRGLLWRNLVSEEAHEFVECIENQEYVRDRLDELGLVAFVGNGAILPRESGASDHPMPLTDALPFESPASHAVTIDLPNPIRRAGGPRTSITGMGIRRGITLIVGGGYHGKSTLLRALECCVYPHIPGDGREWVVSSRGLVKIRAEDGRAVTGVDIQPFIGALPARMRGGQCDTRVFSSDDASGSTSQAANIVEAIEVGATGLLLDEDTSATNFMLRDARMQQLVHRDNEPITPFVDRVRELYEHCGISTVLVMGGCGDYFDVADSVIMMREFEPHDVSEAAHHIAQTSCEARDPEPRDSLQTPTPRVPLASSLIASRGRRDVKISVKSRELVLYGENTVDLRYVTQLSNASQTRAAAMAIHLASERFMRGSDGLGQERGPTLSEVLDAVEKFFDEEGLDGLDLNRRSQKDERHPGNLARPRRFEIAAAINRMRCLRVEQPAR